MAAALRPYLALFATGFARQAAYRAAMVSGLATNVFFGIVRTALFFALYAQRGAVAGLDRGDALTYVWLLEGLFGVMWAPWGDELPSSIRSGDFLVELTRPGDVFLRLLAVDLGRTALQLVGRCVPSLTVAALLLPLTLPSTPLGYGALAVSMALAAAMAFEIRLALGMIAFRSPDYTGWTNFLFSPLFLLSGFIIPTAFLPDVLRAASEFGPLVAVITAPVRVATGHGVGGALALQATWVLAMGTAVRLVLAIEVRRLVVHGG